MISFELFLSWEEYEYITSHLSFLSPFVKFDAICSHWFGHERVYHGMKNAGILRDTANPARVDTDVNLFFSARVANHSAGFDSLCPLKTYTCLPQTVHERAST